MQFSPSCVPINISHNSLYSCCQTLVQSLQNKYEFPNYILFFFQSLVWFQIAHLCAIYSLWSRTVLELMHQQRSKSHLAFLSALLLLKHTYIVFIFFRLLGSLSLLWLNDTTHSPVTIVLTVCPLFPLLNRLCRFLQAPTDTSVCTKTVWQRLTVER